jgi:hypothetical protein
MALVRMLTACVCCVLLACSGSKKLDKPPYEGRSYNHLFILGNTADIGVRVQLETDLAAAAIAKGYTVVKSIDLFPTSFRDPKPPTTNQVTDSLKKSGCDALIVINLKRKEDLKYIPGVKVKANEGILGSILAGSMGYQTNSTDVKGIDKPGSYSYENGFFISSDLADANSQVIVYSTASEMMEYSKLSTTGRAYLAGVIDLMEKQKVLKK